jgi:protein O-mannosyl-transferase
VPPRARPDREPWWGRPRGAAAIVAALAVVAFARSLLNEFTYDEPLVIARAQGFLQSGSFATLFSRNYFAASLEGTWRPFCTLTYMLDAAVSMHPAVFKAQSLAWHIGAAWLLMALARRLLPEGRRRWALAAGLFFVLHPITTETVDNASFREDALVTFFVLATLILSLDGRRWLALGAFGLGLLSKESAVVAPVLLLLLRWARLDGDPSSPRPRPTRKAAAIVREIAPLGVLTVAYLAIRLGPMAIPLPYARYPGGTFAATLAGLPAIWAHDIRLVLFPWPLCADYTGYFRFGRQALVPIGAFVGALALVVGAVALIVVAARRRQHLAAFGVAWFFVALVPVSNLMPIPIPAADRFLYLPLAGISLAVAACVAVLAERLPATARRPALAASAAVLAAFIVGCNVRHAAWRDDRTLWRVTVATNPRACGAQSAIGGQLLSQGMADNAPALLRESAARQELALSLCADDMDPFRAGMTYTRLGAARALLGDRTGARTALERAAALFPRYALAYAWLGYVAHLDGDGDRAAAMLKHAIIDLGPPDAGVAEVARRYVDKL